MLHVTTCNHLPPVGDRAPFASIERAETEGFSRCPLCFSTPPRITGYRLEERIGREAARQLRSTYAFAPDESIQRRLERVGQRVLAQWIAPLKGYRYRFAVVESDEANAVACPAGTIYFTSGLMRALESDGELEATLAHEIAHVELRHGYRQYRSAVTGRRLTVLAALALGAAVGSQHTAAAGIEVAEWALTLGTVATQIALAGYSREHETEADDFAMAYLLRAPGNHGTDPLVTVLSKLRYANVMAGELSVTASAFSMHPDLETRLARAGEVEMSVFDSSATFLGCTGSGDVLLTIRMGTQCVARYNEVRYRDIRRGGRGMGRPVRSFLGSGAPPTSITARSQYRLFTTIEGTAELSERVELGTIAIQSGAGEVLLTNAERTEVFPVDEASAVFSSGTLDELIAGPITGIRTPSVPKVEHWIAADDREALDRLRRAGEGGRKHGPDSE